MNDKNESHMYALMCKFSLVAQTNSTLTYLDCRSNAITNDGLLAMLEHLAKNAVLYQLCLHGNNNLSQETMIYAEKYLHYRGSDLRMKWSSTYQTLVPNLR